MVFCSADFTMPLCTRKLTMTCQAGYHLKLVFKLRYFGKQAPFTQWGEYPIDNAAHKSVPRRQKFRVFPRWRIGCVI